MVSNLAASGSQSATNVTLSDQLPGNGSLVVERQPRAGQLHAHRRQPAELRVGHDPAARVGDGYGDERADDTGRSVSVPAEPGRACHGGRRAVAQASGSLTCPPPGSPQLSVVKTPDNGSFAP